MGECPNPGHVVVQCWRASLQTSYILERLLNVLLQAPTVLRPLEDVHVAEGSDALLTCCVCGRPTPTFEWSSAGRRVDSGRVVHDQLTGNLRLEVSRHIGLYTALIYVSLLKIF